MRLAAIASALVGLACLIAPAQAQRARPGNGSAAPGPPPTKVRYSDHAMGTSVTVWLWTADERGAAQAAEAVFLEMKRLDKVMTTWDPASEVSQINTAAGEKPVKVSADTFAVIARAMDIARRTKGVFDITVGAFRGLWKFDDDMDGTLPDPAEIRKRLALINYREVTLDRRRRTVFLKRKGMSITLGGIAKGFAVDRCAELLRKRGFNDFMIQAGGDMYVAGKKGTEPWTVAIRDPRGPPETFIAAAPIEDHSFSTSGDYERGFVKDGVRYHHILDARTGFPARGCRSVTLLANDAFTADTLDTAVFAAGPKLGMKIIESQPGVAGVIVDADNKVWVSKGLEGKLIKRGEPTPGP
jgi:thiamine biosynthesis lipoprotein